MSHSAEIDALAKALAFPGHNEMFAAWFKDGKKVRHEDVGGIQCRCGWSAPADPKGYRPWDAWHVHLAEAFVASGWTVTPPAMTEEDR